MLLTIDTSARQIGSALIESPGIPTAVPAPNFCEGECVPVAVTLTDVQTGLTAGTAGVAVEVILADPANPENPLVWATLTGDGQTTHSGSLVLSTTPLHAALAGTSSLRALLIVRATYNGGTRRVLCRMPAQVFAAPVDESSLAPTPLPQLITLEQFRSANVIRCAAGAPANALGANGDLYIDSASGDLYERVSNAYAVRGNLKGTVGQDGASVRVGAGVPANTLGRDGDGYVDSASGDLYERISGAYVMRGSLKGRDGDPGTNGLGVPAGGALHQVLRKKSASDNDTEWADPAADATSWSAITDKPATFPPAAHSHAVSDVTGLQTVLDGKQASGNYAPASHTHQVSDISATGTRDATTFLRGDGSWSAPAGGGGTAAYGPVSVMTGAGATEYASWDAAFAAAADGNTIIVWRGTHTMSATCNKAVAVRVHTNAVLVGPSAGVMFSADTGLVTVISDGVLRPRGSILFNGASQTIVADTSYGLVDLSQVPSPQVLTLYGCNSGGSISPNCELVFGRIEGATSGCRRLAMTSGPNTKFMRARFTTRVDFGDGEAAGGYTPIPCGTNMSSLVPVICDLDAIAAHPRNFIVGQIELRGESRLAFTSTATNYSTFAMISCGSAPGVTVRGSLEIAMASSNQDAIKDGLLKVLGVCVSNRPINANVNVAVGSFTQDADIAP